jgi:hypothetical protein
MAMCSSVAHAVGAPRPPLRRNKRFLLLRGRCPRAPGIYRFGARIAENDSGFEKTTRINALQRAPYRRLRGTVPCKTALKSRCRTRDLLKPPAATSLPSRQRAADAALNYSGPESALRSHPCVAVSSAQVWSVYPFVGLPGETFAE